MPWIGALLVLGCAWNPPIERGGDRRGQPSITQGWDEDAGRAPVVVTDAGHVVVPGLADAGAADAGAPDAGIDAGSPGLDCGQLTAAGHELCGAFADACEIIFRDGSGCNAACARAGLVCEDSWNDESGLCAPRRSQHYGCRESGHDSDYCVCVRGT